MAYEIEKGVPIPPKGRTGLSDALRSMNVWDSLVVPMAQRHSIDNSAKVAGIKVTVRKISATEVRVWRIA